MAGALDAALEARHGISCALSGRVVAPGGAAREGQGEGQAGEGAAEAGPGVFAPVVGLVHEEVVGRRGWIARQRSEGGVGLEGRGW